jgi:4-hydroxybenzoate polyprenyltransferase
MSALKNKISEFSELLKLEHSLFALPFAFMGAILAAEGLPSIKQVILISLAMVFARTAGMSFNRVLDSKIDADNPRTKDRAVPAGRVSKISVWLLAFASLAGLSISAYFLNPLALILSPICHIVLFSYSLMKRFTWGCHFFLGFVEAFAPIGGWIAIKGTCDEWTPYFLGAATIFWIAGMDVVYATQDSTYDKNKGLHSIPSKFGDKTSFYIARVCHIITVALICGAGWSVQAGVYYWIGVIIVAVLFIYQHSLVSASKREKLNFAFFGVNSWIAATLMFATIFETKAWNSLL